MSYMKNATENCVTMIQTTIPDGEGGEKTTWTEGMKFEASFDPQTSELTKIAEALGAKNIWNIMFPRDIRLEYHTVFKRLSDGAIFRVTSRDSKETPNKGPGLKLRQVSAEDWELIQ